MPNLRSIVLGKSGDGVALTLTGSDGRSITITKEEVRAIYLLTAGSAASRKRQTIDTIKTLIITALGPEQIAECDLDFETNSGRMTLVEFRDR